MPSRLNVGYREKWNKMTNRREREDSRVKNVFEKWKKICGGQCRYGGVVGNKLFFSLVEALECCSQENASY